MYSNESIIVKKNTDQHGNTITKEICNENQYVYNNVAVLTQIPSSYHRIIIDNFIERNDLIERELGKNEFYVDYHSGKIYFNPCMNNKQITIKKYYGIGYETIPTSRIYTKLNDSKMVVQTLEDVVNKCLEVIKAIDEINKSIENSKLCKEKLEATIGVGNKTINDINSTITNANNKKQELNNTINTANTTNNNSVVKRQELEGTINKANNLKNEIEKKIKDNNVVTNSVFNTEMGKKAEKTDVYLKVSVPSNRDCNSFKTLNAFCSWDTGLGDFKNTPWGTLAVNTAQVFHIVNRGFNEGRFQQEFIMVYPQDRVSRYIRNYNSDNNGQWGRWWKVYDEANKPTPEELLAVNKNGDTMNGALTMNDGKVFVGSYNYGYCCKTKEGARDYVLYIDSDNKVHIGYNGRPVKIDSLDIVNKNNKKIYHEDNKPTANEIGAWDKVATRLEGADFNTVTEGGIYATVRNTTDKHAPIGADGRLIVMSWNFGKWASQMFFADGGRVFSRTATDIEGKGWTPWAEIYSKQFKPTPQEIGALGVNDRAYKTKFIGDTTYVSAPCYDFKSGILIDTGLASGNCNMISVDIFGNPYSYGGAIDCHFSFYDYNEAGGIIQPNGIATGLPLKLKAFRYKGKVFIWTKQISDYQTLIFRIATNGGIVNPSISNESMPTSGYTHLTEITPRMCYTTSNKPTPQEIGAVSKNGDSITGTLKFRSTGNEIEITNPSTEGFQARGVVFKNTSDQLTGMLGASMTGQNLEKLFMGATSTPWDGINSLTVDKNGCYFNNKNIYYNGVKATRITSGDFNTITDFGFYAISYNNSFKNAPEVSDGYLMVMPWDSQKWCSQFFIEDITGRVYTRTAQNPEATAWSPWARSVSASEFTNTFNENGYQKLPNGLIIQWGTVSKHLNSNDNGMHFVDVNYPIRFPNKALSISGTTMANKYDVGKVKWLCQTDEYNYRHPQYATFRVGVDTCGGATSIYINWMAIGY